MTLLTSDFILLRNIVGHDLNDIFNIQIRGLNFHSLKAADGRMEGGWRQVGSRLLRCSASQLCADIYRPSRARRQTLVRRAEHRHVHTLHTSWAGVTSHHGDIIATNVLHSHLNRLGQNGIEFHQQSKGKIIPLPSKITSYMYNQLCVFQL